MALNIRAGGSWLPAKVVRVRVGGTWTPAKTVRQRIAGVWTTIWTALEITCSTFVGISGNNATRTVGTIGGTAPFTVTSASFSPSSGPTPGWSYSGLAVTLGYPGGDAEGSVTLTVTDVNGSTASVTTTYAFTAPGEA
jgi:hypothetical protein